MDFLWRAWQAWEFLWRKWFLVIEEVFPEMKIFRWIYQIKPKAPSRMRISEKPENYTPEVLVWNGSKLGLNPGTQFLFFFLSIGDPKSQYAFVTVCGPPNPELRSSVQQFVLHGLWPVFNSSIKSLPQSSRQSHLTELASILFEFWGAKRRPEGQNLAFELSRNLHPFSPENIKKWEFSGLPPRAQCMGCCARKIPLLTESLRVSHVQEISSMQVYFDYRFWSPYGDQLWWVIRRAKIPFCPKIRVCWIQGCDSGKVIYHKMKNHPIQQRSQLQQKPVRTRKT